MTKQFIEFKLCGNLQNMVCLDLMEVIYFVKRDELSTKVALKNNIDFHLKEKYEDVIERLKSINQVSHPLK